MSWGALPWWVYQVNYEMSLMEMSCAFPEEVYAGTSKELPEHCIKISKATFNTHEPGGRNYDYNSGST